MDEAAAIDGFGALAQDTRLAVFRLLVRHVPDGLPAGEIARMAGVQPNTLSTHLAILTRAGLIRAERQGRFIVYHAVLDQIRALTLYLLRDCCSGHVDLCLPIRDALSACPATCPA